MTIDVPIELRGGALATDDAARHVAQPVAVGIPIPKGSLHDVDRLWIFDPRNHRVPAQFSSLARWADGSIRWLHVEFLADSSGDVHHLREPRTGTVDPDADPGDLAPALRQPNALEAMFEANSFALSVDRAGGLALGSRLPDCRSDPPPMLSLSIALRNRRGQPAAPKLRQWQLQANGPVRASLRLQGKFAGCRPLRFASCVDIYPALGLVRWQLTVHNPSRARHPGGVWDLGDPASVLLRELALVLHLRDPIRTTQVRIEPAATVQTVQKSFRLCQFSSGGANWNSRNHINQHGEHHLAIRGYSGEADGVRLAGLRANPVVGIESDAGVVAAAVPNFWQQFPKGIERIDASSLAIQLFPAGVEDCLELQPGEQKTHETWFSFGADLTSRALESLQWVHAPLVATIDPQWIADSGAVEYLTPQSATTRPAYREQMAAVLDGVESFTAKCERVDEYGWRHFGELYADHENAHAAGPTPIMSHYNNQYDSVYGLLLQWWRTGEHRWHALADNLARHVVDIDVYHTEHDKSAYSGGMFWHTAHYLDADRSTHRTYSRSHRDSHGPRFGGGPSNEHVYTTGLLHLYYLTGEQFFHDVVLGLAQRVSDAEDGANDLLGIIDPGPTGWATSTYSITWHGPGRGAGNSVNTLLDAWLLTGERRWLNAAESLIRRCIGPLDDPTQDDLLDPESRWSYLVFLQVLIRYLNLKIEAGQCDEAYAHARASLLRYAVWMLDNERPFFDRPDKLDFPTETWVVQDLRKPNLMLQARKFTDDAALRDRLRRRAEEFYTRCWNDLTAFPSRTCTRPQVLLLSLGIIEDYCRAFSNETSPAPTCDFIPAPRVAFVSQRQRVIACLKSPRRLLRALPNAVRPRPWIEAIRRSWPAQRLRSSFYALLDRFL